MVAASVTGKGATKPFFVNDWKVWKSIPKHKKHLEKELLLEIDRIMNNNTWIFIQDSVSLHRVKIVQDFVKEKFNQRFTKHTEWLPSSPDCNPLDYHFWFNQPFGNWNELKRKIKKVWPEVKLAEIRKALKQFTPPPKAGEEKRDSQLKCYSNKLTEFVLLPIVILFIIKLVHVKVNVMPFHHVDHLIFYRVFLFVLTSIL